MFTVYEIFNLLLLNSQSSISTLKVDQQISIYFKKDVRSLNYLLQNIYEIEFAFCFSESIGIDYAAYVFWETLCIISTVFA